MINSQVLYCLSATRISGAAVEAAVAVIWEVGSDCTDSKKMLENFRIF
jgi:hypothetical protein